MKHLLPERLVGEQRAWADSCCQPHRHRKSRFLCLLSAATGSLSGGHGQLVHPGAPVRMCRIGLVSGLDPGRSGHHGPPGLRAEQRHKGRRIQASRGRWWAAFQVLPAGNAASWPIVHLVWELTLFLSDKAPNLKSGNRQDKKGFPLSSTTRPLPGCTESASLADWQPQ